jgi:hypothetical protein
MHPKWKHQPMQPIMLRVASYFCAKSRKCSIAFMVFSQAVLADGKRRRDWLAAIAVGASRWRFDGKTRAKRRNAFGARIAPS